MDAAIEVCAASSVTEDVWTFVIVAWNFEEGLKIDAIDDRGFDVCAGKSYESREEPVEGFLNVVANFFRIIIVEDGILRVARAKNSAIGQFSEIAFDGQAANETVMGKLRAVEANVFFFFGNFIDDDVSHLTDVVAANGAFVGDRSGMDVPHANTCKDKEPEFKMRSHQWFSSHKPRFCDSSWSMAIRKISRRCAKENMPSVSDSYPIL